MVNIDESNPHIALLPLHPTLRAKFNETAAWEYARSMEGKPYGYHNMIFSWIDTMDGNYPPPLDAHLVTEKWDYKLYRIKQSSSSSIKNEWMNSIMLLQVASFMTVWNQIQPDYAANLWNEALNKRLGTEVGSSAECLFEKYLMVVD